MSLHAGKPQFLNAARALVACLLSATFLGGFLLNAQNGQGQNGNGQGQNGIRHVLLISIDGMHAHDLEWCVANNGCPALAALTNTGVTFTNAFTTKPSDSIPATVGIFTGASPALGGMYYDDAWHRGWYPPGSGCAGPAGTVIDLKEGIDHIFTDPLGNPLPLALDTFIDPALLPLQRDPSTGSCTPVFPHSMLRVNTVFEVIRAHNGYTAFSEKRPSYDFLNGPSGQGVNDLYTPEIAFANPNPNDTLKSVAKTEAFDDLRVTSILNEINGLTHDGLAAAAVPALFGMNFQAVNAAKKNVNSTSGYADATGTPDAILQGALAYVDNAIGSMVSGLGTRKLLTNTVIIITAKHGESPLGNQRTIVLTSVIGNILAKAIKNGIPTPIATKKITQKTSTMIIITAKHGESPLGNQRTIVLTNVIGNILAKAIKNGVPTPIATKKITQKTSALIWLANQGQTADAVAALSAGLDPTLSPQVLSFGSPGYPFPDPSSDPAPPDIVVVMTDANGNSVNFEPTLTSTTHAEHGGFGVPETHVPLLISHPVLLRRTVTATVSTRMIAPTVLALLGINPLELQAVQIEATPPLQNTAGVLP